MLWEDAGSLDSPCPQVLPALDAPQEEDDGTTQSPQEACDPERGITAFLYLNTPAWPPEWGGALRCHLGSISRDVWGDGGRLVLLREAHSYELLPSRRPQTVLMMRLEGMLVQPEPRRANPTRSSMALAPRAHASEVREEEEAVAAALADTAPARELPPVDSDRDRGPEEAGPEEAVQAADRHMAAASAENEVEKVQMTSWE
ncbi:unnamed protein product, partial [Symbiodinium natans]